MKDLNLENYDSAIFACRPIRPEDYPPDRLRMWNEMSAQVGLAIPDYEDRVTAKCAACEIPVQVGPKQQAQAALLYANGMPYTILCILDAAIAANGQRADIHDLGNTQQ